MKKTTFGNFWSTFIPVLETLVVLQVSEYNMTFYIKVNLDNQTKGQKIGYCMVTTGQDFKFIVGAEQYLTSLFFHT